MIEKQFTVTNISANGMKGLIKLGNDTLSVYDVARLVNELLEENEQLEQEKQSWLKTAYRVDTIAHEDRDYAERMYKENEKLKQQIKDLRIDVLDSIHEAYDIKCNCSPCVVEECVKRVVE